MHTLRRTHHTRLNKKSYTHNKYQKPTKSLCVGILTIPHSSKIQYGTSHIMKTYVDWFEKRNVSVIPIPFDTVSHKEYFGLVNGLVIPGGETEFIIKNDIFIKTVVRFIELSLHTKEYFPIWGTCFGFEILVMIIGGIKRLKPYPAHGFYPISILDNAYTSKMLRNFSPRYLKYLVEQNSCNNNHEFGISTKDFMNNKHLTHFYSILATSKDENGNEYVALIEAKYYPIYGVQWHPERQKNSSEFINFFISELSKNKHNCKSYLKINIEAHKCIQYPEHSNVLCYFF